MEKVMREKKGYFYIGREYSMESGETLEKPLLYDSRDLTTHAVCIGMTGSGKTGLCIDILEEAAMNGIPSIVIDPKGDMTNLLLAFPDLSPDDFLPWINTEDARREETTREEYAKKISEIWKRGLEKWGIEKERIARYRESTEVKIYTPGSKAGYGVSILSSLLSPELSWETEEETLREKVRGTVSALLSLIDYNPDPIRSKEHILLSNIFEYYWRRGEDLSLEKLIGAIEEPPFKKLGVLSLDTFVPKEERRKLLLDLNSIIASPSFEDWIEGEPLEINMVHRNKSGKPKVSIFYTAHLSDNEKIFFTSLLLEELLTWVRSQPGTNDLKSLLYIDEVFGYIPPYPKNPPTKKPLLLLFKQARAFGTGVILTTQNPVDIDYKVLTNAGTWFIGKLQTEQDKERLLEGLETVSGESGEGYDRKYFDHLISSLKKRVFLYHNVHNEKPEVFKTRWAMSYLRGPLTKEQIKRFRKREVAEPGSEKSGERKDVSSVKVRPQVSKKYPQFFLPIRYREDALLEKFDIPVGVVKMKSMVYAPFLFAKSNYRIDRTKPPISISQGKEFICSADSSEEFFLWREPQCSFEEISSSADPGVDIGYLHVHKRLISDEGFEAARDKLLIEIMKRGGLEVYYSPELKEYSKIEETLEDFEDRCGEKLEEIKGEKLRKLQRKYEKKIDRIKDKIERKRLDKERHEKEASARKREEVLSGTETVLSWVIGRRSMRGLSTASRKRRMSKRSEEMAKKAEEMIKNYEEDLIDIKGELEEEIDEIEDRYDDILEEIRPITVRVLKKNITIESFGLLWIPLFSVLSGEKKRYFNSYTGKEMEK
jgi:DNA helicase HerA-like ATPase